MICNRVLSAETQKRYDRAKSLRLFVEGGSLNRDVQRRLWSFARLSCQSVGTNHIQSFVRLFLVRSDGGSHIAA
jgi:hypothetical protein